MFCNCQKGQIGSLAMILKALGHIVGIIGLWIHSWPMIILAAILFVLSYMDWTTKAKEGEEEVKEKAEEKPIMEAEAPKEEVFEKPETKWEEPEKENEVMETVEAEPMVMEPEKEPEMNEEKAPEAM